MNNLILKSILLPLALLFAIGLSSQEKDVDNHVQVGDDVPSFVTEKYGGGSVDIDDLRGKVVLVNFWATWCPSCIQELDAVQKELLDKLTGEDFVFLPISREDSPEKIGSFIEAKGHKFPVYMDPEREIYSMFATKYIPRNYLVDKTGKVVYHDKGYGPAHLEKLYKEIVKLLGK
jgi:peroxiredoxin